MPKQKKQLPSLAELRLRARHTLDRRRGACTCPDPQPKQVKEGVFVITICDRCSCFTNPS